MDTSGAEGNGNMNDGYSQEDTESIRSALKTKTNGLVEAGIAITRQIGELPPRLYHYTDAQALMGIIDNQELWATHASFLNDTSELAWAAKVYREVIAKIKFEDAEEEEFLRRIEDAVDFKNAHFSVYLCSFSEQGDDLNQWRGYGGQSNPVSIGFHALKLGLRFPHGELLSVIYDTAEQLTIADKIVSSSFQFFRENRNLSDGVSMTHYMIECTHAFKRMATYSSLRFKAPHWHSEREWRLIFAHDYRDRDTMPVSFRNGPYSIVPFLKAKVENPGMPIQQITAGPTANRQLAAEAISIYAGNRYISMFEGVSVSEVSLR